MAKIHPQLEAVRVEIAEATTRARRLAQVSDADFATRPDGGGWSPAECVAHLNLTTRAFLPLIDAALAEASPDPAAASTTYTKDLLGRLLAWYLEPPYRMKAKTPASFGPSADAPRAEIVAEFESLQFELERRVEAASGYDLSRVRVTSPFTTSVKYNLLSTFAVMVAHERRHLWQAERALEGAGARAAAASGG